MPTQLIYEDSLQADETLCRLLRRIQISAPNLDNPSAPLPATQSSNQQAHSTRPSGSRIDTDLAYPNSADTWFEYPGRCPPRRRSSVDSIDEYPDPETEHLISIVDLNEIRVPRKPIPRKVQFTFRA